MATMLSWGIYEMSLFLSVSWQGEKAKQEKEVIL